MGKFQVKQIMRLTQTIVRDNPACLTTTVWLILLIIK